MKLSVRQKSLSKPLRKIFSKHFSKPSKNYARLQASAQIINVLPRYFLEIFAFGGMLLLVLYLIFKDSNFMNSVPIIALFAFAGYRILPALQQVYGALTRMRFITSSLDALYEDYKFLNYRQTKKELNTFSNNILSLKDSIILKNVRFIYPNSRNLH